MRIEGQSTAVDYIKQDLRIKPAIQEGSSVQSVLRNVAGWEEKVASNREEEERVAAKQLKQAVDTANEAFRLSNYHLEFQLHERSGKYQIKVVDTDSNKVIREIPPEYMLEISARIREVLDKFLGVFVDALV